MTAAIAEANPTDPAASANVTAAAASATAANLNDPANVRRWLQTHHPKQLALLDEFQISLRLGRFSSRNTVGNLSSASGGGGGGGGGGTTSSSSSGTGGTYQYGRERRALAARTVELLRSIVGPTRWRTAAQLLTLLRGLGNELHAAGGCREPAIGNAVRRLAHAARDEADRAPQSQSSNGNGNGVNNGLGEIDELTEQASGLRVNDDDDDVAGRKASLSSMLWAHPQANATATKGGRSQSGDFDHDHRLRSDSIGSESASAPSCGYRYPPNYYVRRDDLRQSVMEAIQEMMSELEDLHKNINEQAVQHIHAGEIILTYALSKTVELFLKAAAAKKRNFQVIVCEGAPHFGGHAMAKSLAEAGIDTTVIHDAATFAIMARVNKVLLPAHAVLANGGLIAPSGCNMVALAAKQNSVPVVTVAGMFKLCPMYPHEGQDTLNDLISPSSVVDYGLMGDPVLSEVEFVNPVHDYIPPQLIDLYITNIGGFQPSYIYRLLAEYYHNDDWEAFG